MTHPHFRRPILLLLLLLVLSISLWFSPLGAAGPTRTATSIQPGLPAPNFTLNTLEAQSFSLAAFRGRPVILNFWATWCQPCREEMPALDRIAARYEEEGVAVLLINQGDTPEAIRAFLEEVPVTVPVLLDTNYVAADAYRVKALPTTIFIDPQGTIQEVAVGGPLSESDLESWIAALQD